MFEYLMREEYLQGSALTILKFGLEEGFLKV
jgi:hypothetical protein